MFNPPVLQLRRLLWAGPLNVLASIVGVLMVRILAVLILRPNPEPPSLGWVFPTMFTLMLVTGGGLVFAVVDVGHPSATTPIQKSVTGWNHTPQKISAP